MKRSLAVGYEHSGAQSHYNGACSARKGSYSEADDCPHCKGS